MTKSFLYKIKPGKPKQILYKITTMESKSNTSFIFNSNLHKITEQQYKRISIKLTWFACRSRAARFRQLCSGSIFCRKFELRMHIVKLWHIPNDAIFLIWSDDNLMNCTSDMFWHLWSPFLFPNLMMSSSFRIYKNPSCFTRFFRPISFWTWNLDLSSCLSMFCKDGDPYCSFTLPTCRAIFGDISFFHY